VDFLLVSIELFSLGVTAEPVRANIGSKSAISLQQGPVDAKFQVEGVAPYQPFFFQKTRLNDLSYGINISTDLSSVFFHAFDGQSDSQTDRHTDGHLSRD